MKPLSTLLNVTLVAPMEPVAKLLSVMRNCTLEPPDAEIGGYAKMQDVCYRRQQQGHIQAQCLQTQLLSDKFIENFNLTCVGYLGLKKANASVFRGDDTFDDVDISAPESSLRRFLASRSAGRRWQGCRLNLNIMLALYNFSLKGVDLALSN